MSLTDKIRALRERSGLTLADVAKRGGWKQPSSYHRYEDPTRFKRRYLPMDVADRLIKAFVGTGNPQISSGEVLALTQLQGARSLSPAKHGGDVEVIVVAQAGVFRETVEIPLDERKQLPWPNVPGFEGVQVFGLEVRGNAMHPSYPDGSFAYFVRPDDLSPQDGHVVVTAAKRGELFETTLKEMRRDKKGRLALWPLSADPRSLVPLYPSESVEVIGVVIAKFELVAGPSARIRRSG